MRTTKKLTRALSALVELLEDEAAQNPNFAKKLEEALNELPEATKKKAKRTKPSLDKIETPDIIEAFQVKGEEEFRFWLRDFDLITLKAIIKQNGFDPGKNSQRWKEPDKFIELITEQAIARLKRGSTFLAPKDN
jgi:hypothetical protein